MAERVDVCIVGSGFGGSISALRLAELYRAAGADPEHPRARARPRATSTPTSGSRWTSSNLSRHLRADPGRRARRSWSANGVGGGSNLYLAASLRSPQRDLRAPRPPARRRPRPAHVAARRSAATTLDPFYARAEAALRVQRPSWNQVVEVGRPVGGDARRGRPHLRPRAAGDRPRALRPREVVPHRLHLRRQELGHHQLPGRRPSSWASRCGPNSEVELIVAEPGAALPLRRHRLGDRQRRPPTRRASRRARSTRSSARC